MSQDRASQLLILILLFGGGLRFYGLFWDAPYFFNPDEKRLIQWGMTFNYLDPGISEWGTVPLLIIKLLTVGLSFFTTVELETVYLVARILAALLSTLTILLLYFLAKRWYSQETALYSAALTAFTVLHIQYAHFYSLDSLFALAVVLAHFPILKLVQQPNLRNYALTGLTIGLAIVVRLNGIFLLGSLGVAHLVSWLLAPGQNRISLKRVVGFIIDVKLWLAVIITGLVFLVFTPASILNPTKYLFEDGLVWILLQSQGYLKSQYTLQFEDTGPWFYVSNLMFWSVGPVLLVVYLAGGANGLLRWRRPVANLIILTFIGLYLFSAANARVKFIRYCLPVLPLLNILAAELLTNIRSGAQRNVLLHRAVVGLIALVIISTASYALAFVTIYGQPDIRIVAADWIKENIPPQSKVVFENDVVYAPPIGYYDPDPNYRFAEINLNELYRSSPLQQAWQLPPNLERLGVTISRRGKSPVPVEDAPVLLPDEQKEQYFGSRLRCADYLILSDRHYSVYRPLTELFPVESDYYGRLFNGQLGFQPIERFARKPNLLGWPINDDSAELTFRIFDHPTIWIFQSNLPSAYLDRNPPQVITDHKWADAVSLIGFDLGQTAVRPGESVDLTLYWQALANMTNDYTIFLQAQGPDQQIVAQSDHQVAEGILPTSCWQPGHIIVDRVKLTMAPDASLGRYQLKTGLYFFETLERLPLTADTSGENAARLTEIEIIAK